MNDKIKDIVVTIIFLFTIISLFLINVIKKDTDISIAERRKLATMPELTAKSLFDGTYFKKFDSYVTDQFIKRDTLAISEITSVFMEDYEKWLKDRKPLSNRVLGDRALSLYPGYIRALHNLAKKEYNDEDSNLIK